MARKHPLTQDPSADATRWQSILWIAAVALIYFIVARFSLSFTFKPEGIAAIWPPAGIFLSAILLTRLRVRPYLMATLFFTDLVAEIWAGTPPAVSLIYAAALTGDAALGAWLLRRFVGEPITFQQVKHVVGFLLLCVLLSNGCMSVVAALAASVFLRATFWSSWLWWWSSEGVGSLLVTPLIVSLAFAINNRFAGLRKSQVIEGAVLFLLTALINSYALTHFLGQSWFAPQLNMFVFPFLIWAALRFGVAGTIPTCAIVALVILRPALAGSFAPLGLESNLEAIIFVQVYIAMAAIPSLLLGSLITERKEAEEALREREEKYRQLFNNSEVGMFRTRLDGSEILEFNEKYLRILGYTSKEVEGSPSAIMWVDKRERDRMVQLLQAQGHVTDFECELFNKQGAVRRCLTSLRLYCDQGILEGSLQDITEHKRAEAELRLSEERFKLTFENSLAGIALQGLDGRYLMMNPAYCEILGCSAQELLSSDFFRITHPDDIELSHKLLQEVLNAKGKRVRFTKRYLHKDGHTIWAEVSAALVCGIDGAAQYFVTHLNDITDRREADMLIQAQKEQLVAQNEELMAQNEELAAQTRALGTAEAELRQVSAYNRNLFEASLDPLFTIGPHHKITDVNAAAEAITGYTRQQMLGTEFGDYFTDPAGALAGFQQVLREGRVRDYALQIRHRAGQVTPVLCSASTYQDETGQTVGILASAHDIAERQRAEALRREMEVHLQVLHQMDRLRAELIGNVSHELRTPLGVILMMTTALLEDRLGANPEVRDRFLRDIEEEAHHLQAIVDQLLAESQLHSGRLALDRRAADVRMLIRRTVELQALQTSQHRLSYQLPEAELLATLDAQRIEQVLRNLLDNAVKYSPPGAAIIVSAAAEAETLRIAVSDEGPGIPPAERDRIFERFYRVVDADTSPVAGLGLGLSICQGIVEAHGGRLWVEERPGGGSVFVFTLPKGLDYTSPDHERRRSAGDRRKPAAPADD